MYNWQFHQPLLYWTFSPADYNYLCELVTRAGLHPLDFEVGKWLRKNAPHIHPIVAMNKSESLDDGLGSLTAAAAEVYKLGFGDPVAISAETGMGMAELYEALRPLLEDHMVQVLSGNVDFLRKHYLARILFNLICLAGMRVFPLIVATWDMITI